MSNYKILCITLGTLILHKFTVTLFSMFALMFVTKYVFFFFQHSSNYKVQ